ncbi:MAG: HlyD family efflux transporter periplasmic adaptor subunit [Bacteroidales bacterium]|nr:HlyD family efflux transporter periplasmic adaptor subunit [Bacteroidales bacterium]
MVRSVIFYTIFLMVFSGCNNRDEASDAYGNFEAEEIMIASEMQGKLVMFNVEEGKVLTAGELVGIIDTTQLYLSLNQLRAKRSVIGAKTEQIASQIRIYEEQQKRLTKEIARVKRLKEADAATGKQLDDLESQYNVAQRQIESIRTQNSTVFAEQQAMDFQIMQVEDQIKRCYITNPVKGKVLQQYAYGHELVVPGKNLYKIAPDDHLFLRAYISGGQLPGVTTGQEVEVIIDRNTKENDVIKGVITWISDEAEFTPKIIQTKEERVKLVYALKVKVQNDDRLKIGMPGEVRFLSSLTKTANNGQ